MRKRVFDLAGESHRNEDGTFRQLELAKLSPGAKVELVREPNNPYDATAVRVDSINGITIGYIARDDAPELSLELDAGRVGAARVHEMRGGVHEFPMIGCRVSIKIVGGKFLDYKYLDRNQMLWRAGEKPIKEVCETALMDPRDPVQVNRRGFMSPSQFVIIAICLLILAYSFG